MVTYNTHISPTFTVSQQAGDIAKKCVQIGQRILLKGNFRFYNVVGLCFEMFGECYRK